MIIEKGFSAAGCPTDVVNKLELGELYADEETL